MSTAPLSMSEEGQLKNAARLPVVGLYGKLCMQCLQTGDAVLGQMLFLCSWLSERFHAQPRFSHQDLATSLRTWLDVLSAEPSKIEARQQRSAVALMFDAGRHHGETGMGIG
jgi:hypothetical protein